MSAEQASAEQISVEHRPRPVRRIPMPSLAGLYLCAGADAAVRAVRPGGAVGRLPEHAVVAASSGVPLRRLEEYRRVVGGEVFDGVHRRSLPSVLVHILGFPVQVGLMAEKDFPLPLMGLVHLSNEVEHRRPIGVDQPVQIRAQAQHLRAHRRGVQVDLILEVLSAEADPAHVAPEDILWRGASTYLSRGARLGEHAASPDDASEESRTESAGAGRTGSGAAGRGRDFTPPEKTALWRFGAGAGRAWAAVSGDSNPIHLSALSARALGMPGAIAHGMHAAARMLEGREPQEAGHRWGITFEAPIRLPSTVAVAAEELGGGQTRFTGWNPRRGRRHFHGHLQRPADD